MDTYRLLSFDGGGIRGYISASILAKLEEEAGSSIMPLVSGVAGTSTGGLIALGLSAGMTPAQLVQLYRDHADEIFSASKADGLGFLEEEAAQALGFPDPRLLTNSKYTSEGLRSVLSKYLGDKVMSSAAVDVAVNTARLWDDGVNPPRWRAVTATSFAKGNLYADKKMIDLACATSAAPTYFPPHQIADLGYFSDGGMFANNPVLNAFAELRGASKVQELDKVEVVSFGTGLSPTGISDDAVGDPNKWGIFKWLYPLARKGRPAMPLMSGMFDLGGSSTDEVAQGLFGDQISRIQPILKTPIVLDDHDAATFKAMDAAVAEVIKSPAFDRALSMIRNWMVGS